MRYLPFRSIRQFQGLSRAERNRLLRVAMQNDKGLGLFWMMPLLTVFAPVVLARTWMIRNEIHNAANWPLILFIVLGTIHFVFCGFYVNPRIERALERGEK